MSTRDIFWSIPPIQDAIVAHLDHTDKWNCIQVSKAFHNVFIPSLWKTIDFQLVNLFFASPALHRHGIFVRDLDFNEYNVPDWGDLLLKDCNGDNHFPFLNLTALEFEFDCNWESSASSSDFIILAGQLSSLESLKLRGQRITPSFLSAFQETMSTLPSLNQLYLNLDMPVSANALVLILQSCHNLETLKFWSPEGVDPEPMVESPHQFSEARLKSLFMQPGLLSNIPLALEFLAHCPRLESLHWGTALDENAARMLAGVILAHCQFLTELSTKECQVGPTGLDEMFKSSASLTDLGVWVPAGLSPAMHSIGVKHGQTLQYLNLALGDALLPWDLFVIASSCSELCTLQMRIEWHPLSDTLLEKIKARQWTCLGLTVMKLLFDRPPGDAPAFDPVGMDVVYRELGRLTKLENWSLYIEQGSKDLMESFLGGLHHLVGLKDLTRFQFVESISARFTNEDLERILEVWKSLELFGGLWNERFGALRFLNVNDVIQSRGLATRLR